jgi:hypothetical protein
MMSRLMAAGAVRMSPRSSPAVSITRVLAARRVSGSRFGVAQVTGQAHMLTDLLAGKARALIALGRLPDAFDMLEESIDGARLIGSRQQLVFALTQKCLALAWSGDHDAALVVGEEEAATTVAGSREVWDYMARNARGIAMVVAGRLDESVNALVASCADFQEPKLDRAKLVATCELLAQVETGRGGDGARWADMAVSFDDPGLPVLTGLVALTRAHVVRAEDAPPRPGWPRRARAGSPEGLRSRRRCVCRVRRRRVVGGP